MASGLELAEMVVDLTRLLSAARWERDRWRLLAIKAIHEYASTREHAMEYGLYRPITDRLLGERDALLAEPRRPEREEPAA
jgi:hypothetical protein